MTWLYSWMALYHRQLSLPWNDSTILVDGTLSQPTIFASWMVLYHRQLSLPREWYSITVNYLCLVNGTLSPSTIFASWMVLYYRQLSSSSTIPEKRVYIHIGEWQRHSTVCREWDCHSRHGNIYWWNNDVSNMSVRHRNQECCHADW